MAEVGSRAPTPATGSHAGQSGVRTSSSAGAVMSTPMGTGAPASSASTSADAWCTATAAYATAAPQFAAAFWRDAGPEATRGSGVAAAAVGTASGRAEGEWRPSGLPWGPQLRRGSRPRVRAPLQRWPPLTAAGGAPLLARRSGGGGRDLLVRKARGRSPASGLAGGPPIPTAEAAGSSGLPAGAAPGPPPTVVPGVPTLVDVPAAQPLSAGTLPVPMAGAAWGGGPAAHTRSRGMRIH
ncbi:unnamed protein product [Lampetra fluviatilis]